MDDTGQYFSSETRNCDWSYSYGTNNTFTITYDICAANYPAVTDVKEYYGYIELGSERHFVFQSKNDASCASVTLQLRAWPSNSHLDQVYT